jgi:hypothetical protein
MLVSAFLIACNGNAEPPLVASDIIVTESTPGRTVSAGYFVLSNNTNSAIRVSRIVSPQFGSVEIHESLLENGVAKMRPVEELSIAAHSNVSLQPGGKHLMLMHPHGTPEHILLNFYDDETLLLSVQASITRRNH